MKRNSICACAWLLLLGSATAQAQTSNPHPNPGDVTWMMLATVRAILMTIPGLAAFLQGHGSRQECTVSTPTDRLLVIENTGRI